MVQIQQRPFRPKMPAFTLIIILSFKYGSFWEYQHQRMMKAYLQHRIIYVMRMLCMETSYKKISSINGLRF